MTTGVPSLLSDKDLLTASAVAALVIDMRLWVNRAVEQAVVIDDVAIERRHSIDFTVPSEIDGIATDEALGYSGGCIVPITFLRKERLRNFDLRDADGSPVPMLSRRDNGRLATNVLVAQAEGALGCALPCEMLGHLEAVAEGDPSEAQAEMRSWTEFARDPRHVHQREWEILVGRAGFSELAGALSTDFIVCAVTDPDPGKRKILKLSYEKPFGHRARSFLAWRHKVLKIDTPQCALADSYHFEMAAPPETEAVGAVLISSDADGFRADIDEPKGQRVHLYERFGSGDAQAWVFLRPRRSGYVRSAALVGALATLLLWLTYAYPKVATGQNNQVTAALLLLGPTLFAAALVRPGEHRLVTSMLFWIRALIVGSMIACVVVVAVLAGVAPEISRDVWLGSAILASVCCAGLAAALVFPRG